MEELELHRRVISEILADRARDTPDKPFIHIGGVTYSYGEVFDSSTVLAKGLVELGLVKGQRVVMMLGNRVEFLFSLFASALAGLVIVPINPDWKGDVLSYILTEVQPSAIILTEDLVETVNPVLSELSGLGAIVVCDATDAEPASGDVRLLTWEELGTIGGSVDTLATPSYDDVFGMLYSSGTTGRPKGIVLPHAHVYSFGVQWINANNFTEDDVLYSAQPLFYMQGTILGLVPVLMSGAQVHYAKKFSLSRYWDDIRATKATIAHGQFSLIPLLLKEPPSPLDKEHNCTRIFVAKRNEEFESRFGTRIVEIYGSTELNIVAYNPWDHPKFGSAGKAAPNFEVKVVDDDDCDVPTGEIGEIVARPREPFTISFGYYRHPEVTVEAWRNLWFHCGDRGYFDEDGYLFFVDRKKDVIRRKGENISSEEVERQVNSHAAVLESAAVPVPAETAEDEVKVFVVTTQDMALKPEELIEYLQGILPKFMLPRYLEFIDALPKTDSMKIEKFKLRELGNTERTWDREVGGYLVK
jgi:crotonobetaine/carnitine-CoA ligase